MHKIYNLDGALQDQNKITEEEYMELDRKGSVKQIERFGNRYLIKKAEWNPAIVKVDSNNNKTEIVKDPIYFWLMQQPQPLFLLGILGMISCAIFSIKLYFLREFAKI